jgi:hypothetical protein
MADDKTYVRLERAALVKGGETKTYANWELRQDGKWVLAGAEAVQPLEDKPTYLRLERKGDKLSAAVSHDGQIFRYSSVGCGVASGKTLAGVGRMVGVLGSNLRQLDTNFSILLTLSWKSFSHAGASRQSLSSWAPPTFWSCFAVGV